MNRGRLIAAALLVGVCWGLPVTLKAQTFSVTKTAIGGEGGHDYIVAEPGTGRLFVSRGSHVMVLDGPAGKLIGDIADTPDVHGIGLAPKWNHGFTTNRGDSTLTLFDMRTLEPIRKIPVGIGGLDGIMYDASIDRIILTNHSRPAGTAVAVDAKSGEITGTAELEDTSPEGAASDGEGRLFVNNEGTNTIQVLDAKSMTVQASWPIAPCEGPTGIAYDKASNRIFSGCSDTSVAVDAATGKVVASIPNGDGVDGIAWDASEKLLYIPAGRDGNVTIVRQNAPDDYTVLDTVATMKGTRTITVDPVKHVAYVFTPEYGPPPPPAADERAPAPDAHGRGPRGPLVGAWLFAISH
jgi:DNA-binding beta-propeller fold protein YncE